MRVLMVLGLVGMLAACTGGITALPPVAQASAVPIPVATATPLADPALIGAACSRSEPATPPETGDVRLGGYVGQLLPNGYNAAHTTEAEVTAKLRTVLGGPTWPCFTKFYGPAAQAFLAIK